LNITETIWRKMKRKTESGGLHFDMDNLFYAISTKHISLLINEDIY